MNQYRMEIAAERLASGRESTDIALDTGFNNISYFNRVLRKALDDAKSLPAGL